MLHSLVLTLIVRFMLVGSTFLVSLQGTRCHFAINSTTYTDKQSCCKIYFCYLLGDRRVALSYTLPDLPQQSPGTIIYMQNIPPRPRNRRLIDCTSSSGTSSRCSRCSRAPPVIRYGKKISLSIVATYRCYGRERIATVTTVTTRH